MKPPRRGPRALPHFAHAEFLRGVAHDYEGQAGYFHTGKRLLKIAAFLDRAGKKAHDQRLREAQRLGPAR